MGTGGAIAVGQSGSSAGPLGGAASAQYCNGKAQKCKPKPKHNCGKHHNQLCKPKHHKTKGTSKGKTHKAKPKPKSKKKTGSIPWPNCTIRQAGGVVIAYCP